MKNNIPYEVALNMPDEERHAYAVVFASFEGNEFDWDRGEYKKKP